VDHVLDVVDYEEHRSGRRLDGLVFSTALFAIKFGLALGGAVVGWVLGMVDYARDRQPRRRVFSRPSTRCSPLSLRAVPLHGRAACHLQA
jgi:Na+/melibiose symporter-like transporter